MPQNDYLVKARSRSGRLVSSKMRALSEADALTRVRQQGLTPIAVEPVNSGLKREITFGKGRVKTKDLAIFSRQFATMLSSGLPILRCLAILSEQTQSARLRDLLIEVRDEVEKGDSLSEAFNRHKEFPALLVSMVRAGEVGGFLDSTMVQIADSLEADVRLRGKIKGALTYPIAVGIIAVLIVTGMLIFVVPVFSELFASFGGELPLPTQLLVNMSNLVKNPLFFVPTLVVVLTFTFWYRANKDSLRVRQVVDPMKFRLPVFGKLLQKVALARFTRNFSGSPDVPVGQFRPGRAGRWPPRLSMSRAMRAGMDRNPNAMRVMSRILVFTDSMRPLDRPFSMAARIDARCLVMLRASLTNGSMRQRRAHASHRSRASMAWSWGIWNTTRRPSLSR